MGLSADSGLSRMFKFDKNVKDLHENFSSGVYNLLIATSVVDEGIDVPMFNTVIRYDFPENFRLYCQSRGRARADNSLYLILTPIEQLDKHSELLESYYVFDQELKHLHDLMPTNEAETSVENTQDEGSTHKSILGESYVKGNLVLYKSHANIVLNAYLQTLPNSSTDYKVNASRYEPSSFNYYFFIHTVVVF